MQRLIVVLEGGLVSAVVSSDPALIGREFSIVDYDTRCAAAAELTDVDQGDGTAAEAIVWSGTITESNIKV